MCRHEVKDLIIKKKSWEDNHSYGSDTRYEWYLTCSSCGAKGMIYSQFCDSHNGIDETLYQNVTKRRLDFEELKRVFKENNRLFHQIRINDRDLKRRVMSNPKLECRIRDLEEMAEAIDSELRQLRDKYNRGDD